MTRWPSLILLLLPIFAKAQPNSQYLFRHIDQQEGLLHNKVTSIAQDKDGFIWIATANGIQRFDGFRFVNYENQLKAFSYSPMIRNIYPDTSNNIWITSSQLACINTISGKSSVYTEEQLLKDPRFQFEAYTDGRHRKWLLSNFALFYADSASDRPKLFSTYAPRETSQLGNTIFTDTFRHCIWVTNHNNLMLFDKRTKTVYTAEHNPINNPILKCFANKSISFLLIDKAHNIWAAEWNSAINKYDEQSGTSTRYYPLHPDQKTAPVTNSETTITTLCIYQDSKGSIWMGNDYPGLYRYSQNNDRFEAISERNNEQKGLEYNYFIQSITEDRDGNIWLGTDKGISVFNPHQQYFYSISHQKNNPSSLPEKEITSFLQTRIGTLYVGTWGGGFSLYDSSLKFKETIIPKGVFELPLIWCLIENQDGKVWAAAQHGYLHIYDPVTRSLETLHPPEMENKTIRYMKKDVDENIWFGLNNGKIVKWDKASGTFYRQPENGLKNQWPIRNIFIDNHKQFWACTDDGLLLFDPSTLRYLGRYRPSLDGSNDASHEMHGVEQVNDSIFAVGTMRFGLYLFNTHTRQFTRHPAFLTFPATNIFALKKDADNDLWMSSDYYIYELHARDGKLIKHDLPAGLVNSAFEMFDFYTLQNSKWLTASKTEAVIFDPAAINSGHGLTKKVTLTGLKVFDKEVPIDSVVYYHRPIRLNYKQNFISLEFTTLSYFGITQNINYELTGVDKDWVKANEKAVASYTDLSPGEYVFKTKAGDQNNESGIASLTIIITPPFYLTWWFRTLAVSGAAIAIYLVGRKRIQNIRHKADLRHKIAETEMMALRSQMNPHFIFNCLSAIDNLIQTNQPDKATTYLARFAKLIRSVLESTKNNLVPFYKDFESLQLYVELEQFRCGSKFLYQLTADDELLNGDYKVPPLIVQPFAENAIHHGLLNKMEGSRTLVIRATLRDNYICYSITDNGVGRKKAMEIKDRNKPGQTSYGLGITEERIHLHNQKYTTVVNGSAPQGSGNIGFADLMENGRPAGTEVTVQIKCDH
ncbi:MAG: two-component regulator propeller domain-containing protein [Bacteroidota bacterium]|nr:two-component regulator propeller domain-containing protein [Bacteroidota bacterium]